MRQSTQSACGTQVPCYWWSSRREGGLLTHWLHHIFLYRKHPVWTYTKHTQKSMLTTGKLKQSCMPVLWCTMSANHTPPTKISWQWRSLTSCPWKVPTLTQICHLQILTTFARATSKLLLLLLLSVWWGGHRRAVCCVDKNKQKKWSTGSENE